VRHERVNEQQGSYPPPQAIRGAGDNHACIAMTAQNHLIQLCVFDETHDVFDMGLEVDGPPRAANRTTETGQCKRVNVVPGSPQAWLNR
jgi:hypothetical protein